MPFPKGMSLKKWMTNVNGLGQDGVASDRISIFAARFDAKVTPMNTPSQAWIASDSMGVSGSTMYFSFDTPVTNSVVVDQAQYCGRAVFSDLHVSGNPSTMDTSPPPSGCVKVDLSPQEKALEFMLFDLSSCVIPDTVAPIPVL
jgi:hypothetical protein